MDSDHLLLLNINNFGDALVPLLPSCLVKAIEQFQFFQKKIYKIWWVFTNPSNMTL